MNHNAQNFAGPRPIDWDDGCFGAPPPIPKRPPAKRNNKKGGNQSQPVLGPQYQGPSEDKIEQRRNYKKDWLPPPGSANNKKDGKKKKDGKTTYL